MSSENDCKIQPIILCGGSGTRLWPVSKSHMPKQLINLGGNKGTLLQETLRRINNIKLPNIMKPILVMHKSHKLPEELLDYESNVLYENFANDTAVAVARSCIYVKNLYPNYNMVVVFFPSDHYIYHENHFISDIVLGINQVTNKNIVLYGLRPNEPSTKYGYIFKDKDGVKFYEKPTFEKALELIERNALWNSGIFSTNLDFILDRIYNSKFDIMSWVNDEREGKAPSFDVAILQEEHDSIECKHCHGWNWSDVGTWENFINIPEIQNELSSSSVITSECNNIQILNRGFGKVVTIGCNDLLIVVNGNDVLIMPNNKDYNNHLKNITSEFI